MSHLIEKKGFKIMIINYRCVHYDNSMCLKGCHVHHNTYSSKNVCNVNISTYIYPVTYFFW